MKIAVISDIAYDLTAYSREDTELIWFPSSAAVTPADWFAYEAAFLAVPFSEAAQLAWTGHPHLRVLTTIDKIAEEIGVLLNDVECERKFLVAYPDVAALAKYHPYCSHIEQIYLVNKSATHRLRKRTADGVTAYIETLKIRINGARCTEIERTITKDEFEELLELADPEKHAIVKDRYCFLYKNQYFELDLFDFWKDKAVVELELKGEDEAVELPPELTLIGEVTDDVNYKNNHLASVTDYDNY